IIQNFNKGAITLDMPANSTETPTTEPIPLAASKDGSVQWNLAGNPLATSLALGDLRLTTNAPSCSDGSCGLDKAKDNELLHNKVWIYNGNNYNEKGIGDNLQPWDGFWIPTLAGSSDYNLSLTSRTTNNHINEISASDDGELLTLQMTGGFIPESHFAFFIDTDNNPETGYTSGSIRGADSLAEGNGLFQYLENAQGGKWNKISADLPIENTPTQAIKRIPLSLLNANNNTIQYTGYVATPDWKTKHIYPQMKEHKISNSNGAFTVSTFHTISLYWSPPSGSEKNKVFVEFKETGEDSWKDGYPLIYNPLTEKEMRDNLSSYRLQKYDYEQMYSRDINELANSGYRGSIVQLKPNTAYDIRLSLEGTNTETTLQARTWSEGFPIAKIIQGKNSQTGYEINESGTEAAGYVLYDGTGAVIDGGENNIQVSKGVHHIIIRGYELKNAEENGVLLGGNNHHIVIENNDISNWGGINKSDNKFGENNHAAIRASLEWGINNISTIVIQKNKIHDPRYTSNNWAQKRNKKNNKTSFHPWGPQALSFGDLVRGNLVIRYNEIWSDNGNCFNDAMGGGGNRGYTGFPGSDSDIYGNYISGACDDAIEAEGNDINVRIWNNYITNSFLGIANAAVTVGPLYVWKNVFARARKTGKADRDYGGSIKGGEGQYKTTSDGFTYFFNNTMLQPDNAGFTGIGGVGNRSRGTFITHFVSRNNILHVSDDNDLSISSRKGNSDVSFDYDLLNGSYPAGQEKNGYIGIPTYQSLFFDEASKEGDFRLLPNSAGHNQGKEIPNFTDGFYGSGPDIGAHEDGVGRIKYGINASE
ncbi:MAG: hypothetical protein DSZ28_03105, partial [Thiothrix sp.]